MGGFLIVGLIVVIIVSLVNFFIGSFIIFMVINVVVVLIMFGLILFDISCIINGGEINYICVIVFLYLNVYNLFIFFLYLFGVSDD